MKFATLWTLVLFFSGNALQAESAYEALRAFGAARGKDQLNQVIEVQGRGGGPQPKTWKIILDDPSARGGVREVEIRKGEIISEKTPVRDYSGAGANAVMNFGKLNLDSEGAFTIANREATKARIGFDKVDYTLRIGDETTVPVWIMELVDASGEKVGTVRVAADSGAVLRGGALSRKTTKRTTTTTTRGRVTDEDYLPEESVVKRERTVTTRERRRDFDEDVDPEREYSDSRDYGYEDEGEFDDHRGVRFHIKKAFVGAGASLEEFFTGRRTLDRRYREE